MHLFVYTRLYKVNNERLITIEMNIAIDILSSEVPRLLSWTILSIEGFIFVTYLTENLF